MSVLMKSRLLIFLLERQRQFLRKDLLEADSREILSEIFLFINLLEKIRLKLNFHILAKMDMESTRLVMDFLTAVQGFSLKKLLLQKVRIL